MIGKRVHKQYSERALDSNVQQKVCQRNKKSANDSKNN